MHLPLVFLVFVAGFLASYWFLESAEHVLFQSLFLKDQAVLVPDEVWRFNVEGIALHAAFEQAQDVAVVRVCGEGQRAAVLHELLELCGLVETELVNRDLLLFAFDVVVLLVLGASRKTLPGQGTAQEVQKHVTNGLEIISARLLVADVRVERGVSGGSCEVFAFFERNMLALRIFVAFGETEVNDVDIVFGCLGCANQEVVRLDVSVNNPFFVDFLNAQNLQISLAVMVLSLLSKKAQ